MILVIFGIAVVLYSIGNILARIATAQERQAEALENIAHQLDFATDVIDEIMYPDGHDKVTDNASYQAE